MNRYICIHGHFYQPPRENPWLETIELQDSAAPYHDWNERITAECYAPNTASRILDDENKITKITNNYSRISFNFGPTLLSWMETKAPATYAAILEADTRSMERFGGHGSAIAQVYNHVIMPLADRRDKETQIIWGIRDFEHRFGRRPEGMWLAETAVDLETLDLLAEHGIVFTVLAPHQAKSVRAIGEKSWSDVSGSKVDPSMPYRIELASGRSIALFFYDGPISRGVAFERLLGKGELLADRLVGAFSATRKRAQLVHIATDGETYGHHHHRGDMALSYALDYIERHDLAKLTNYGQFLELFPPTHEAEIHENTSWSCHHGVQRWRADCGCNGGAPAGWNQKWREPLRDALDWLRDEVAPRFEQEAHALVPHPWRARNHYIDVVLDPGEEPVSAFIKRHGRGPLAPPHRVRLVELLELQRNAMLMYTSCGWFFNDINGIETRQILRYAGRVLQLARTLFGIDLEPAFLERLTSAKSNEPELGDGRRIYEKFVRPAKVEFPDVAAHYAVASLFETFHPRMRIHCYEVEREDHHIYDEGSAKISVGRIRIRSRVTHESARLMFGVLYLGDVKLTGGSRILNGESEWELLAADLADPNVRGDFAAVVRLLDRHFEPLTFSIRSLFRDEQRTILSLIWEAALAEAEAAFRALHDRYLPLVRLHSDLAVPLPRVLSVAAEADLNLRLRRALEKDDLPRPLIDSLLEQAKSEHVSLDRQSLTYALKQTIDRIASRFEESPSEVERLELLHAAIDLVLRLPFEIDLWLPQNVYYKMLDESGQARRSVRPDEGRGRWSELFRQLGPMLWIRNGTAKAVQQRTTE